MSQDTIHAFASMPVRHNGQRYETDSPITDAAAAKFLVMHCLARPAPASMAASGHVPEQTPAERTKAIIDAMLALDTDNAELFTADGKPQVSVLSEATGLDITAEERDNLWAEVEIETGGAQG